MKHECSARALPAAERRYFEHKTKLHQLKPGVYLRCFDAQRTSSTNKTRHARFRNAAAQAVGGTNVIKYERTSSELRKERESEKKRRAGVTEDVLIHPNRIHMISVLRETQYCGKTVGRKTEGDFAYCVQLLALKSIPYTSQL
ncbi:hypothetical protein ROHU_035628 [Labeo rohita]|uniref:Uncharacterized protein n=1 Tax=Labeo rohita TaxID=84645 RepID=A0A498LF89_LABRO|nr:hypothetical protein ROHU_035628 [Labeo rohita]